MLDSEINMYERQFVKMYNLRQTSNFKMTAGAHNVYPDENFCSVLASGTLIQWCLGLHTEYFSGTFIPMAVSQWAYLDIHTENNNT